MKKLKWDHADFMKTDFILYLDFKVITREYNSCKPNPNLSDPIGNNLSSDLVLFCFVCLYVF